MVIFLRKDQSWSCCRFCCLADCTERGWEDQRQTRKPWATSPPSRRSISHTMFPSDSHSSSSSTAWLAAPNLSVLKGLWAIRTCRQLAMPGEPSQHPCGTTSKLGGKSPGCGHSQKGHQPSLAGSKLILLPVLLPYWPGWEELGEPMDKMKVHRDSS